MNGISATSSIKALMQELEEELASEQYAAFAELFSGLQNGILGPEAFEQLGLEILPTHRASLLRQLSEKTQTEKTQGKHSQQPAQVQPQMQLPDPASMRQRQRQRQLGIVWHKWSDLRLLDHEPAHRAHVECDIVLHIHVVEEQLLVGTSRHSGLPRCGPLRRDFWQQCVVDLAQQLNNIQDQQLMVAHAHAAAFYEQTLGRILQSPDWKDISSATVYAHSEFCHEELTTQSEVKLVLQRLSRESGIPCELKTFWGGLTVHHPEDLERRGMAGASFPLFKGQYNTGAKKCGVRSPIRLPARFKPGFDLHLAGLIPEQTPQAAIESVFGDFYQEHAELSFWATTQCLKSTPPTSAAPYYREKSFEHRWTGGETAALQYLEDFFKDGEKLGGYRGATESFAHGESANPVMSGTRLSPWLAFGCISARYVIQLAKDCERRHGKRGGGKSVGKGGSTGTRLHTELNFRDFLRFATLFHWGSKIFRLAGPFDLDESAIAWKKDHVSFEKWRLGQTGFPFIDAGMRELRQTGYMSHLHRQCCASFLVRDLQLDWRWGAEHFESCLVDYTPDANWGNWAYRILQRPGLAASRAEWLQKHHGKAPGGQLVPEIPHISTVECVAWPVVHDCRLEHTSFWCPELKHLPSHDLMREPWRVLGDPSRPGRKISIKPYKDSPLWFCAANRTNWGYEYYWLPGSAYVQEVWTSEEQVQDKGGSKKARREEQGEVAFKLGRDYPYPMVRPLNVEVMLKRLPVRDFVWGDSDSTSRPHVT